MAGFLPLKIAVNSDKTDLATKWISRQNCVCLCPWLSMKVHRYRWPTVARLHTLCCSGPDWSSFRNNTRNRSIPFFLQFLHGLRNYFQLVWDWNQVSAKMLGMLCSRCLGVFMWRMVVRAPDGCSPDQQWPHPPSQIVRGLTLCTDWSNYDWQWSTIELFLKHPNDGHNSWSSQDG